MDDQQEHKPQEQPEATALPHSRTSSTEMKHDSLSSSASAPSDADSSPEFTPLDPEVEFEPLAGDETPPEVIPFTGEEIARGVALAVTLGLHFETAEEAEAFEQAFMAAIPIMPTPAVLDYLGVGEALAEYGIHKGTVGGPEALEALPPWLRLLIGAGYLAFAVYTGVRAAKGVKGAKKANAGQPPAPGPHAAGAGPREEVPRGPFQTAGTL